jgi:RimJ/RimL family protein N-acetyltransferase
MNIWQGQRVRLRGVEPGDWQTFDRWDQDSEVARLCYHIEFPRSQEGTKKFAAEAATAEPKGHAYRWMIETLDGVPVGTINTHSCDLRHGTFGYGLAIAREHWRQGYASEAVCLVLAYYFRELRYQKVTAHVYAFNEGSIRLHEKLGFQLEGRLRRMVFTDGAYHDELVFGMTAVEFEARYPRQ